jgi:hypothetical protein
MIWLIVVLLWLGGVALVITFFMGCSICRAREKAYKEQSRAVLERIL